MKADAIRTGDRLAAIVLNSRTKALKQRRSALQKIKAPPAPFILEGAAANARAPAMRVGRNGPVTARTLNAYHSIKRYTHRFSSDVRRVNKVVVSLRQP